MMVPWLVFCVRVLMEHKGQTILTVCIYHTAEPRSENRLGISSHVSVTHLR